jgi:hypothetical protein
LAAFSVPAFAKKHAVAGHRVVGARAGQDQAVAAAERRHHDRRAISSAPRPGKIEVERAVATRSDGAVWIGRQRQRHQ